MLFEFEHTRVIEISPHIKLYTIQTLLKCPLCSLLLEMQCLTVSYRDKGNMDQSEYENLKFL